MELLKISPDSIRVPGGRRRVDDDRVLALMDSIRKIGLQTPVTIWFETPDSDIANLVTGAHRVEACRRLDMDVDAFVTSADTIDRDLWEIDENLCRSELTEAEEAQCLARRKELWEARETANNIRSFEGRGNKGFASETAAATGKSARSVQKKVARAERIEPEVLEEVKGTDLDKGTVLDEIAKAPRDQQRAKIIEIRERQEDEKLNRYADKAVARSNADEAAEIIHANLDLDQVDMLMARLAQVKMPEFLNALAMRRAA